MRKRTQPEKGCDFNARGRACATTSNREHQLDVAIGKIAKTNPTGKAQRFQRNGEYLAPITANLLTRRLENDARAGFGRTKPISSQRFLAEQSRFGACGIWRWIES
jgi:hypothetical protein